MWCVPLTLFKKQPPPPPPPDFIHPLLPKLLSLQGLLSSQSSEPGVHRLQASKLTEVLSECSVSWFVWGFSLRLDLWLSLDSQRFHDSRKVKPQIPEFHHSLLPALWPPAVLPPHSIFSYFSLWFMRTTHTTLLLGSHTHLEQLSSLWALQILFHWLKSMWTLDLIQFHSQTSIDEAHPCSRAVCPGKRDTDHMAAS